MLDMSIAVLVCAAALLLAAVPSAEASGYGGELDSGGYGYGGPAPVLCSGECVGTYDKCAGKNIDTQLPCCNEEDQCVMKNSFYSQCRPEAKGIPMRWSNGIVLADCTTTTTTDPTMCEDDSAFSFKYNTAQFTTTSGASIDLRDRDFFLDLDEEACKAACIAEEECVVYQWTEADIYIDDDVLVDDDDYTIRSQCLLRDASVISTASTARPRDVYDRCSKDDSCTLESAAYTIAGVKCFYPPAICDAGDVKEVSVNGQYFMDRIGSFRSTQIMLGDPRDGPRENIITECANLCAMGYEFSSGFDGRGEAGLCNGFAIEGQGDVGDKCILLYPEGPGTIPYITDSGDFTNIYSIADCIATDPNVCNDSAISFKYETAELLFTTADPLAVRRDLNEEGCKERCVDLDGCVVYEWRDAFVFFATDQSSNDEDIPFPPLCSLYDSMTIPDKTQARPRDFPVNGEPGYTVAGVKCYYPSAVCEASTVLEVSKDGEFFTALNDGLDNTKIQVGPGRSDIVTECANLCALGFRAEQLEGGDAGVCNGFAIDGDLCTLLYPQERPPTGFGGITVPFMPGDESKVYSIVGCIA